MMIAFLIIFVHSIPYCGYECPLTRGYLFVGTAAAFTRGAELKSCITVLIFKAQRT